MLCSTRHQPPRRCLVNMYMLGRQMEETLTFAEMIRTRGYEENSEA